MPTEVILTSNIKNLGAEGDQIKVSDGYARNFLIPQKLAIPATEGSRKRIEALQLRKAERERAELAEAQEIIKKLEKLQLALQAPAGEHQKLFGSVTNQQIAAALVEKGFEIDRKQIEIETPIRKAGNYEVKVKLHHDLSAVLKIKVEGSEEPEAEAEKKTEARKTAPKGKTAKGK